MTAYLLATAILLAVLTRVVWQLEARVRQLESDVRELGGRPTLRDYEQIKRDVLAYDYEAIGGTGNMHRRKLGWRVRVVIWWVGVRERVARWLS